MKKRDKIITQDGSHSFYVAEIDEHYHSDKGAIQESNHIFIGEGLLKHPNKKLTILEVGFGTGLNAFLTYHNAEKKGLQVKYISIEKYPLLYYEVENLNYAEKTDIDKQHIFKSLHRYEWNKPVALSDFFELHKVEADFTQWTPYEMFDIIYFDAFSPEKQPEMWSEKMFEKIYKSCNQDAILVTYSVKGVVKRALKSVGFQIEKRKGPPGKREILVAKKIHS